jgi:hypothetical protein
VLPGIPGVDTTLIRDGVKPIPGTLTFCGSCGEWLPSSLERKQTEELIAALRLLRAVSELAGARLEHADRPDLRVHLRGHTYGLEVTRIARGGAGAISRAQWRRAVERTARLLRRERGDPPVWVNVRWNPEPPRGNAETVAQQLVDLVEQRLKSLPVTDHAMADIGPHDLSDDVAPYVHGLLAVRTRADDHWTSGFSLRPDVSSEELRQEIGGKASLVAGYSSNTDGLWLLIYAEALNAAQALDMSDEARSADYSGPFDRVFFLDRMDRAADLRLS